MLENFFEKMLEAKDPEAADVARMIKEAKLNALEKALRLVKEARGLGLENPASENIWDSYGMTKARFAELNALSQAIREAAPTKTVSMLAVDLADLTSREKVLVAFLM